MKRLAFLTTFLLIFFVTNAQTMKDYTKLWQQTDKYVAQMKPDDARKVIDSIYNMAKKQNNQDQILKCHIYYLKINDWDTEDAFEDFVKKMEGDLPKMQEPNKSMMHSLLAQLYWQYYQANLRKITKRTTIGDTLPEDIKTWTAENFVQLIIEHYTKSLKNEQILKSTPISFYTEMINKGTKPNELRPTLFDFLISRAIDFYSNSTATITRPADYFQINDTTFFSDAQTFANADFSSSDTLAFQYQAVLLLQKWLKFRLDDKNNPNALIDADFKRLNFVYNYSVLTNKDELYVGALDNIIQKFPNAEQIAYAIMKKADYYEKKADLYNFQNKSTWKYKDYYIKALELFSTIVEKYPDNKELAPIAKYKIRNIKKISLSFDLEDYITPNKDFYFQVSNKNISKIYVDVRKIDYENYYDIINNYRNRVELMLYQKSKEVNNKEVQLPVNTDYQTHTSDVIMDKLPSGCYLIFISDKPDINKASVISYALVQSTNLGIIFQQKQNGDYFGYVLNTINSKPVSDAKIKMYKEVYHKNMKRVLKKTFKTDDDGYFEIKANKNYEDYSLDIYTKNDSVFSIANIYLYSTNVQPPLENLKVTLFTDRKLYRPGQTVYFKGLCTKGKNMDMKVMANYDVNVVFEDVNNQQISKQNFKTNDYGTFQGSFTIPTGLLNGTMHLSTPYGSVDIQVEEYKRPAFVVTLDKPKQQYLVNQEIEVKGNAVNYSGVKLSNATVKYSVKRKNRWYGWWWWDVPSTEIQIKSGTTKTDDNGNFSIDFTAIPDLEMPKNSNTAFDYTIKVDVTDINGETHSATQTVAVGYTALKISTDMPDKVSKQYLDTGNELNIDAINLNNENVDCKGVIKVFSLKEPKSPYTKKLTPKPSDSLYSKEQWFEIFPNLEYNHESDYRYWSQDKQELLFNFDTKVSKKIDLSKFKILNDGVYKIVIESKDKFGNDIKIEEFFVLYDEKSNKIPYPTNSWIVQKNNIVEPGQQAVFFIGAYDNVTVRMQIARGYNILETKTIHLKNEQKKITFPVTENLRGGFSVNFIYYVNKRIINHNFNVNVPYSNKKLKFEFATFRENLLPGQKEEWKIIVKNPDGSPADAELLTFMYDASLDAIRPYGIYFSPFTSYYSNYYWNTYSSDIIESTNFNYISYPNISYSSLHYPSINWFGFYYRNYSDYYLGYRTRGVLTKKVGNNNVDKVTIADKTNLPQQPKTTQSIAIGGQGLSEQEPQIRKNFNETAFFYPQLQTDKDGNVVFSFTMPDALTQWRFLGLAHTTDVKYGIFDKKIVTQKKLMVMPNMPRFFRQGDTMFVSTKISNLSDKDLKGNISLEFIDDITEKPVENILAKKEKSTKSFTVKKGGSSSVTWKIEIPDDAQLLTYRIIAKADNFSDGEQKTIPVLTNRILVTESLPLPVRPLQTKAFTFKKLVESKNSKTIKTDKLTVEFTSNPAWYAVQALPYLIEYPYECNEQTFARLYANTLASFIANSNPKIKAVFERWKNYEPSALTSNLEKNQDLKSALLEETPWVLNAQNETQRKRNIGLLFDLNRMAMEKAKALRKLKMSQHSDGGWPWFEGMYSDWWVTQYIVEGTGHLLKLNIITKNDPDFMPMMKKAISYLDNEVIDKYNWMKKHYTSEQMDNYIPSALIVHYFYARSFYDKKVDGKLQEAYNYFYSKMKKNWTKYSLYNQGLISLVLFRNTDQDLAKELVESFRQRAIINEELGMYWKENVSGYYWYQNPIQTQALMIEVFDEIDHDTKSTEELKIWLLKNKQTNDWGNTVSTAEAIYSLLLTDGVDILSENDVIPVKLGKKLIDPANDPNIQAESGTGYYRVSFNGNEVVPEMGNISINNTNNVVTWGAVYWQYFEDIDKITGHETNLKLQKDLFKVITTETGEKLQKITTKDPLKVGDLIVVRMEIRVDRDMEYVHIKDLRASGFEPVDIISGYRRQDGLGYYQVTKDASTNFFIGLLRKGTYVFEYRLRANNAGNFSNGITTIQCMYAPEFTSHTKGQRVVIKN